MGRRSSRSASWRSRVKTVAPRLRAARPATTACARKVAVFTICTPFARSRGKRMSARIMISRGSLTAPGSRLLQHALDVADHHVLRPRCRLHAPTQRSRERAAEEAGHVAVLAQGAEPRVADPRREAPHRDSLPEVVLFLLPLLGEGDEGVGLLLLLQRPRGVAG